MSLHKKLSKFSLLSLLNHSKVTTLLIDNCERRELKLLSYSSVDKLEILKGVDTIIENKSCFVS